MRSLCLLYSVLELFVWLVSGQGCPDYSDYSQQYHPPFSSGRYNLSYQRPDPDCRTFTSAIVEDTIQSLNTTIADPDLFRLFENSYPNTLDTAVKWKGYASGSNEELTFLITGDMSVLCLGGKPKSRFLTVCVVMQCGCETRQIRCSHTDHF